MKGQSAVEYIMTYGWAILALMIVLAALVASGVLSPNYLVSEECSLGSNIPCSFAVYNEGGQTKMSLMVYNGFPYKIKITDMNVELRETGESFNFGTISTTPLESGANRTFMGVYTGPMVEANAIKRFSASVIYVSCAPEISESGGCSASGHTISGKVVARVISE